MSMPVAMSVPAAVPASGVVSQTSNGTEASGEGESFAGVLESVTERDSGAPESTGEETTGDKASGEDVPQGEAAKQPEAAAAAVIEVAVVAARVVVTQATAEPTLLAAPTTTVIATGATAAVVTAQGVAEDGVPAVVTTAQAQVATPEGVATKGTTVEGGVIEGAAVEGIASEGEAAAKPAQAGATAGTTATTTIATTVTITQPATPQNTAAQQIAPQAAQSQTSPTQPQQGQPAIAADLSHANTTTQGQLGPDAGATGGEGQGDAEANLAGRLAEVQIANDKTGTAVAGTDHAAKAAIDSLGSVTKTGDLSSVVAKSTLAASAPQPLPEPIKQVVSFLSPLRQYGDGDYKLLLQLHPEHLGRVEVAVSLNNGQINMSLNSDNASSRQLLKDNMPDLRAALADAGLDAGTLDVGNQSSQGRENAAESGGNSQVSGIDADIDEEELFAHLSVGSSNSATDGPLDVRI